MKLNDAFPLHSVPGRLRAVILHEFQGRCPTVQEVAQRSDKQWLAVPGIGPSALGFIRSVTDQQLPAADAFSPGTMSGVELLDRLASIQEELRCIRDLLKFKLNPPSSSGTRLSTSNRMRSYPAATHELRV
jgi:hypothetical protein